MIVFVLHNSATFGGGIYSDGGPITLINTLLANSTPHDKWNCEGGVASLGHNLATDSSCNLTAGSDQENSAPLSFTRSR